MADPEGIANHRARWRKQIQQGELASRSIEDIDDEEGTTSVADELLRAEVAFRTNGTQHAFGALSCAVDRSVLVL